MQELIKLQLDSMGHNQVFLMLQSKTFSKSSGKAKAHCPWLSNYILQEVHNQLQLDHTLLIKPVLNLKTIIQLFFWSNMQIPKLYQTCISEKGPYSLLRTHQVSR
jgi:hypothetical protein